MKLSNGRRVALQRTISDAITSTRATLRGMAIERGGAVSGAGIDDVLRTLERTLLIDAVTAVETDGRTGRRSRR